MRSARLPRSRPSIPAPVSRSAAAAARRVLAKFPAEKDAAAILEQATRNHGSGLILEKGLAAGSYTGNSISQNSDPQVFTDADLATGDEPEPAKPR